MRWVILSPELEIIEVHFAPVPTSIPIPDDLQIRCKADDGFVSQDGTILSQEDVNAWTFKYFTDVNSRRAKIESELLSLIGLNVLSLTDAQRWKLVAAVFYKLGVINSNGVINPYKDWLDC